MAYETLEDHTQMRPGDLLEYRCPRFGIVTQWRVEGIHLGALHQQSVVEVTPVTHGETPEAKVMMVPEEMTRSLPIIRAVQ